MHLIQSVLGVFLAQSNRPGRVGALEYSMVAGLTLVAAVIGTRLVLSRLDVALAQLTF